MIKNIILFLVCFLSIKLSSGQDKARYQQLINEAWSFYESKEYLKSGQKYSEAFVAFGNKGAADDRYNAACSWALANIPDSSFVQLFAIANNAGYSNLGHLTTDTDLETLHNDPRWNKVIAIVRKNKEGAEAGLDKSLVAVLDSMYQNDQKYRMQLDGIAQKYGWQSAEIQTLWKTIHEKDSINQVKVSKILDERGWLGAPVIGKQGSQTLFLVVQHAELDMQLKYLPMMRDAIKKGNASPSDLALLEDRVSLRQGKRQIYGSQVGRDAITGQYYVLPLDDPDNVDIRRLEVGLGKLQDYISHWGMTWNAEEYKKQLPEIEAKQKK